MEYQKILNLLNDANVSKFMTRKWNITNDNVGNEFIYNTRCLHFSKR